ncbi:MAG TPA: T9SS type A sorting domain-containing protein [Bacteroidales bacterium]|nr:T9SS type A sorting domain-containing protein [Bacteroidales bacterium]
MKIIRLLLITLLSFSSLLLLSQSNVLSLNDVETDCGSPLTVEVEITNTDAFAGFQFDLVLPTGFSLQPGSLVLYRNVPGVHSGLANQIGSRVRVLVYSFPATAFSGNSGIVATFILNTPAIPGTYPLEIYDVPGAYMPTISNLLGQNIITGWEDGTATLICEPQGFDVSVGVSPVGAGTVTGAGEYDAGEQVTVAATAAAGYLFVNWTDGGDVVSTSSTYTFMMPAEDVALTANFTPIPTYTVTVNVVPAGAGSVTGSGVYEEGDPVTLTASAAVGYLFVNWTDSEGVVSTANPYAFAMPAENLVLTANFATVPTFTVVVDIVPVGAGTVTGAGAYEEGEQVTLTASAGTGYSFVNWTEDGGVVSTANPYVFDMPAENLFLTANFAVIPTYEVILGVDPAGAGTALGAGMYQENQSVTVMAMANPGYQFVNWTDEADIVVSAANPYVFPMPDEAVELTANFTEVTETFDVTFNIDMTGAAGFNPATDDVYLSGTFNGWTVPPTDPEYEMFPESAGSWIYTLTLQLPFGTYEYKYYYMDGTTPVPETLVNDRIAVVEDDIELNDVWGALSNIAILHDASVYTDADDITVDLEILNSSVFVAFQFDIPLPAGFTYQAGSIEFSGREADHTINAAVLGGNVLRILASSLTQAPFTGNNGNVCSFVLDFTAGPGAYPITFDQAIISDALMNNVLTGTDNGVLTILPHVNVIQVVDTEVLTGNPMTVPVAINNTQEFVAFQCTIQLPVGFSYVTGSVVLDPDRVVDHTIVPSYNGATRQLTLLATSLTNTPFLGNEGNIATFIVNTPPNPGPDPDLYDATISNPFISDADAQNICSGVDNGVLTILAQQNIIEILDASGLCNRDLTIEVAITNSQEFAGFQLDVPLPAGFTYVPGSVALDPDRKGVNHTIVGSVLPGNILRIISFANPNELFLGNSGTIATFVVHTSTIPGTYPAPVVNGHISDITGLLELITGTIDGEITIENQNLFILHDASQLVDHPVTIEAEIDNTQDFVAFQADIAIPAGFTYVNGSAVLDADRKVDHEIFAQVMPGNILRVIASSLTNEPFLGFNGTIFTFVLNTPNLPGPYNLNFNTVAPYNIVIISSPAPPVNLLTGTDNGVITLLPDVNCPDDFEVCIDAEPFILTGGTPVGGIYTGPGVSGGMFYPAIAGAGIHEITYTYTYPNLISGSCTFEITVNPLPVVTCPENFSVCLEAEPWMLYGGLPEGGEYTGTGVSGGMFDPEVAGPGDHVITYTYTDENTCVNFCTFTIHVYELFEASIAADQTICYDSVPEALTSTVTGGAGIYTYQWWIYDEEPVEEIEGATEATYQPPALFETTSYVLQVFDECGMIITDPVTITVYGELLVTIAADQTICYDSIPAALTSVVSGGAENYIYQWWTYDDGPLAPIEGATEDTYQPPALQETTSYVLQLFDDCGMIISDPVTITVYDEFLVSIAEDQTICYDSIPEALTSIVSGGAGNYTYQWWIYDDGPLAPIEDATEDTYQPPALQETTSYVLQVFDDCGMIITNPVTITVYEELLSTIAADQVICYNTVPELLTSTTTGGNGEYLYHWEHSTDGVEFQVIEGAHASTYQPSALTQTTYYRLLVDDTYDCGPITTNIVTITVLEDLAVTIAADQEICNASQPEPLTSEVTGGDGEYTYQWQMSENGEVWTAIGGAVSPTYQPGILIGTTYYNVVVDDGHGCGPVTSNAVTITVYDVIEVTIAADQEICNATQPEPLTSVVTGGDGAYTYLWQMSEDGEVWTAIGGAISPTYEPGILIGTTYYNVVVDDGHGCGPVISNTVTIIVYDVLAGSIAEDQVICYNTAPELLTSTVTGGAGDYEYQWQVFIEGEEEFEDDYSYGYPDLTDPYAYESDSWIEIGWAQNVVPPAEDVVVANVKVTADQICSDYWYSEVSMYLKSPAGTSVLIWSGFANNGCTTDFVFTTDAFDGEQSAGQWLVYFIDSYGDGGGTAVGVEVTIEYTYIISGVWMDITGATGATYQPGVLTDTTMYKLYVTDYCGEIFTEPVTISVTPLPTADAGEDDEFCENQSYTLNGTATNYSSVLWTTAGDGTFDDATLLAATYTPGDADIVDGEVVLTLTAFAMNECPDVAIDQVTLEIGLLPTVNAGDDGVACEDGYYQTLGWTTNAWTTLWTTSGDGYFVDPTSTFTQYWPGSADIAAGSAVLTLTANPVPPCTEPVSDQVVVTFVEQPTANAGPNATICGTGTHTLNGTAANYSSLTWTTSGDGTFSNTHILNPVYTPGAGDIASGSATLTLTAYAIAPCSNNATDAMTLTIIGVPQAFAGPDGAVCAGNDYVLNGATASGYGSLLWTTSGSGTFVNPNMIVATYQPSAGDIADGVVVLTLTAYAQPPCGGMATDAMTLTITTAPSAFAGDDFAICSTEEAQLEGTADNYASLKWTSSGDGTFSNANILDPVYTPGTLDLLAGTVDLTLTAYAEAPCGEDATDQLVLTIAAAAFANAGPDDKICANELYQLSGVAGGFFYTEWTSSGDGKFNDNTLLNATYEPGTSDILLGYVNLTLTAWPIDPCPDPASDMMVLLIDPIPAIPGIPSGADTVCVLTTDTTWYQTIGAANALSYVWDIFPAEAGTISGEGTIGVVDWSGEYFGPVFIKVKGVNDCGEGDYSDALIVVADPCPGIPGKPAAELTVNVYPNPSDAKFNVKITNITGKLELSLMDITGQILKQETVESINGFYKTEIDIATYPKGVYFLRLYGDDISKVERLILR